MDLGELQRHWDAFGRTEAMWSVLTSPGRKHRQWEREEFYYLGDIEIDRVLGILWDLDLHVPPGPALDFGCGLGRLTQALTRRLGEADGVDIAPSMIEQAGRNNRYGDRCRYHVNQRDDLAAFPDGRFAFVYSAHVLQHMEPRYAAGYVREFVRVLKPGGLAAFQICTERVVGADQPLPDDAFRAEITPGCDQLRVSPRARVTVGARITNRSDHPWPAAGRDGWFLVMLRNHWRNRDGKMLVQDDGRALLPDDLPPGASVDVDIDVTAPGRPGRYRLELDLVQEGVTWFADRGSATAVVPVTVAPSAGKILRERLPQLVKRSGRGPGPDAGVENPTMEMYGLAEADVRRWVQEAGGEVIAVVDWRRVSRETSKDWERRLVLVRAGSGPG